MWGTRCAAEFCQYDEVGKEETYSTVHLAAQGKIFIYLYIC